MKYGSTLTPLTESILKVLTPSTFQPSDLGSSSLFTLIYCCTERENNALHKYPKNTFFSFAMLDLFIFMIHGNSLLTTL